jgi:hypothetical protein
MTEPADGDQPPSGIIHLDVAMRKAADDEFWAIRGKAVQSYANLEQSLCTLFSALAGVATRHIGAVIFFKIVNTSARNSIIEKLFKLKFPVGFNLFRNSLLEALPAIDQGRNEIVHWSALNIVGLDDAGVTSATIVLKPAAQVWGADHNIPQKTKAQIIEFMDKADFYSRLVNMFYFITFDRAPHMGQEIKQTWYGIFSQPIIYPPPADHPLSRNPPAPTILLPPSEG